MGRSGRSGSSAACRGARLCGVAAAVGLCLWLTGPAGAIVSSGQGLDINSFIGADRFYDAGYTGSLSVIANIEGGHIWNLHETLTHVSTFLHSPIAGGPDVGEFDTHTTRVGQVLGGRGGEDYQMGIAPDADLWSGAIATEYPSAPSNPSFNYSLESLLYPYETAMRDGVGGRTADVVNSSWGLNSQLNTSGWEYVTAVIDTLAWENGSTVVIAAGNKGPVANSVIAPATGHNVITVGALGDGSGTPPYQSVAAFSGRGPADYRDGSNGQIIANARAVVDIVAPGHALTLAKYGGTTGSNSGGSDPTGGATDQYYTYQNGTSFAAPLVAGGAALLTDVGYDLYGGAEAIDGRVIKSVLLNSAAKPAGWNNGQTLEGGVITTTQALDYAMGAGALDLDRAFDQYTAGTADLPGLAAGGADVAAIGWDYGQVVNGLSSDYYIADELIGQTAMNVTLSWFMQRTYFDTDMNSFFDVAFDDLNVEVWQTVGHTPTTLVAESATLYNTTEHLSFHLPADGYYMVRVVWAGEHFDVLGVADEDLYGLAWSATAMPLPGDMNGDGVTNLLDINPFVLAITDPLLYEQS